MTPTERALLSGLIVLRYLENVMTSKVVDANRRLPSLMQNFQFERNGETHRRHFWHRLRGLNILTTHQN